jgi:hypothetical protein
MWGYPGASLAEGASCSDSLPHRLPCTSQWVTMGRREPRRVAPPLSKPLAVSCHDHIPASGSLSHSSPQLACATHVALSVVAS